jgi:hypothetical protein
VVFFRCATLVTALFFVGARAFGAARPETVSSSAVHLLPAVMVFAATQGLATVFSIDPWVSVWGTTDKHGTATVLTTLLFFFLVSRIARAPEARRRIVSALLAGSVPVALYSLTQLLNLDPLEWETDSISPMVATMGRSNFFGAYLAMVIPFTLARLLNATAKSGAASGVPKTEFPRPPANRWRWAALASLQGACIFLTQARAAWCGALVGTIVSLCAWRSRPKGHGTGGRVFPLLAVVVTGGILFVVMNVVDIASLGRSGTTAPVAEVMRSRTNTVQSRLTIWRTTLELSREHWLLGHGPETFASVFDRFYGSTMTLLYQTRGGPDRAFLGALVGSVSAYLVQAQFNPDVVVLSVLFWLNLAFSAGASSVRSAAT